MSRILSRIGIQEMILRNTCENDNDNDDGGYDEKGDDCYELMGEGVGTGALSLRPWSQVKRNRLCIQWMRSPS